jgi:putative ABC transport system ATP-binding protein
VIRQLLQRTLLRRRDLAAIELLVCDVDGVLTDGGLHYDEQGQVVKRFDVRDGLAIRMLQRAGIEVAFLSGGRSGAAPAAGEHCALEGRSGSGKSTLLNVVSGILRPDSGRVIVDSIDVTRLGEAQRDRVRADKLGLVFQQFNLLPGFTALENVLVAMSFGSAKPDRWRAADLLASVGLSHRLHHRPAELSIGQQQRVAVARALANRPRAILADEPTASVDSAHQQQVIDLLRATCAEQGVALLVVTHAPEVARQVPRRLRLEDFNRAAAHA